jgi:hypothetical protein
MYLYFQFLYASALEFDYLNDQLQTLNSHPICNMLVMLAFSLQLALSPNIYGSTLLLCTHSLEPICYVPLCPFRFYETVGYNRYIKL